MDKQKMMAIVNKMCAYQSASCRGLDMADMARELLDMASVPATAVVSEIPVSDGGQVIVYFYVPGDDNYYMLFAGDGCDGSKANFKLYIDGKNPCTDDFYFLDKDIEISIDHFKDTNMANTYYKTAKKTAKENNWTMADGYAGSRTKRIFDFSLLDTMDVPAEDKECIIQNALRNVYAANRLSLYSCPNTFDSCSGSAAYANQAVYDRTGKRLYNVLHLIGVTHTHGTRKTVYEEYDCVTTETKDNSLYDDIELEV